MPYSYLIALTHFVPDREQDYNDWYRWVHLRDVMRLGFGVIAAQRFRAVDISAVTGRSKFSQPYLCIYETTDPCAMTAAHAQVFTDEMPISDAYTSENASEVYFDEIAGSTITPGEFGRGDVIIERIDAAACKAKVREWYQRERFPALCGLSGIIAGSITQPNDHQMFEQDLSGLCAIYWTRDIDASVAAWPAVAASETPEGVAEAFSINAYAPVMERLTMIGVRNPSDEDLETAQLMRDALGDNVLSGPPETIKSQMFE